MNTPARNLLMLVLFWIALRAAKAAEPESSARQFDRNQVLSFRDMNGTAQTAKSPTQWNQRRAEIVRSMEAVMGPLPGVNRRCPLNVKIEEETDCGRYLCRFLTYASEPGSRVPAWLLLPKAALHGTNRFPAVLCPHPTAPVEAPIYARELAERGYVTLTPNYPLLGKYQPDLKTLGWQSGTMKAIWDNIRGLDLLDSQSFVKAGGRGAIGHSLGGHNSIYTAVFDPRIVIVVSSCGFDSYLDYYGGDPANWQPERGWCQARYMPALTNYAGRLVEIPFDFHEMIAALAPRRVFISAPLQDINFRPDSVDRVVAAASQVYALFGNSDNLHVEHPACGHDFPTAMREKAYRQLDQVLR